MKEYLRGGMRGHKVHESGEDRSRGNSRDIEGLVVVGFERRGEEMEEARRGMEAGRLGRGKNRGPLESAE